MTEQVKAIFLGIAGQPAAADMAKITISKSQMRAALMDGSQEIPEEDYEALESDIFEKGSDSLSLTTFIPAWNTHIRDQVDVKGLLKKLEQGA